MKRIILLALVAMLAAFSFAAPLEAAKGGNGRGNGDRTRSLDESAAPHECTDDGTAEGEVVGIWYYQGPLELWPPNHKDVPATLTFVAAEGYDVKDVIYMSGHDQYVNGEELNGSGNTDGATDITPNGFQTVADDSEGDDALDANGSDIDGTIVERFSIRSERSGRDQDGRQYYISGKDILDDESTEEDETLLMGVTFTNDEDGTEYRCGFEYEILVPHDQGGGNSEDTLLLGVA